MIRTQRAARVPPFPTSQKSWVFATNSDFLISISLQPNAVDLRYFKLLILINKITKVWNIKGFHHKVAKILESEYFSLWQKLNSFSIFISYQPDGVYLWYFKLRLFESSDFIVWILRSTTLGLQVYRDLKKKLNSFLILFPFQGSRGGNIYTQNSLRFGFYS